MTVLCMGAGAPRDWTLSGGVSRKAGVRAHQECSLLISCKGAQEKQCFCRKTQMGPMGYFSFSASLCLADLRLWCRYHVTLPVLKGDKACLPFLKSLHIPLY